ncbi:MAG: indole-3-glycerol phosphate synthase [Deltaproteobacteria bacterium]|jgi:indole-3-glycerol phosphate synthase|nr:indole-3-glycerol phosphate synthase TrpC [SAR324 cluster bacterium]PQM54829.1 MAG: indole-3-glycerol phosphate synthase [Deltaproteobacteria bacterium]RZO47329.1 MAG: indole-3-glycerol-phosphate synthase [Pseudomonadota bacterium]HJL94077.1 indole-3-glycerol phosphate synthase TrpC [SAR324 cluster bacterium]|tara:strand:+ start:128 stop:985 length:858 start_codon:yes stop_codon:yes gene_type:complete
MRTFLDKLHDIKLKEVDQRRKIISENNLRSQAEALGNATDFRTALLRAPDEPISLIAEVKSKAPGRKNVENLDPEAVVRDYESGGAKAISVLTDNNWFGGSLETLEIVRETTILPLLHKEFIITPYQLLEGRVRGASAALILAYYFQQAELCEIINEVKTIGLEAVIECSLENELSRVLEVNPDILMINNRAIAAIPEEPIKTYNLGSVDVISSWWERNPELRSWKKQPGKLLISASCVNSPKDIQSLLKIPCDAALIGNAAMVAPDRSAFIRSLSITAKEYLNS